MAENKEVKTYNPYDRVPVKNTVAWDVHFDSKTNPKGEFLAGKEECIRLTYDEVFNQVALGNTGFVGTDGFGNHAVFQLKDLDQYNAIFRTNKTRLPEYFDDAIYKKLVSLRDEAKFKKMLEEKVITKSDKRMLAYKISTDRESFNDAPNWMIWAIESYTESKISQ